MILCHRGFCCCCCGCFVLFAGALHRSFPNWVGLCLLPTSGWQWPGENTPPNTLHLPPCQNKIKQNKTMYLCSWKMFWFTVPSDDGQNFYLGVDYALVRTLSVLLRQPPWRYKSVCWYREQTPAQCLLIIVSTQDVALSFAMTSFLNLINFYYYFHRI